MRAFFLSLRLCLCYLFVLQVPNTADTFGRRKKDYTGARVLRITLNISMQEIVKDFHDLCSSFPYEVELWGVTDLFVPRHQLKNVTSALEKHGFLYEVMVPDVQRLLDEVEDLNLQNRVRGRSKRNTNVPNDLVGIYAPFEDIKKWLAEVENAAPEIVNITYIGTTHEGRNITLLKIGIENGREKPAIWLDGGTHAREWISPASLIYIIHSLVDGYHSQDNATLRLLEEIDWYIVPLVNPDGYVYSHEWERFWRKNVSPDYNKTGCLGVDLNRNFDYHWGEVTASIYQCAEHYMGPNAASEPETRAISRAVMDRKHQIKSFITVHSYAQLWLTRWSYTNIPIDDHDEQISLANKATAAIHGTSGYNYTAGVPYKVLYPYSGGSTDWARAVAGIKYTYCVELRDRGQYAFLLPEEQIIPVGEELFAAVKVVAEQIIEEENQADKSVTTKETDLENFAITTENPTGEPVQGEG